MSVKLDATITKTAKPAEPPKQSAPAQPWVATGLYYYHNQYVQRAADLGCCGVTQLLIIEENSLPARAGKIALFAIASVGYVIYDVLYAVWEKISCGRDVAPATTTSANKAPNTDASSTTEDPAKTKDAKSKKAPATTEESDDETETSAQPVDLSKLTTKFNLENPQAVADAMAENNEMFTKAIVELRAAVEERAHVDVVTGAINQLAQELNFQNTATRDALTAHEHAIADASTQVGQIRDDANHLSGLMNSVANVAKALNPQLAAKIMNAVPDKSASKEKKPSAKNAGPSQPNDKAKPKKGVQRSELNQQPQQQGPHILFNAADDEIVPPLSVSHSASSASMQPNQHLSEDKVYKGLLKEAKSLGHKLGYDSSMVERECMRLPDNSPRSEIKRLNAITSQWTAMLITKHTNFIQEAHGVGNINVSQIFKNIDDQYPFYGQRLAFLEAQAKALELPVFNALSGVINTKCHTLGIGNQDIVNKSFHHKDPLDLLRYLKGAVAWLDGKLAEQVPQPEPKKANGSQPTPSDQQQNQAVSAQEGVPAQEAAPAGNDPNS